MPGARLQLLPSIPSTQPPVFVAPVIYHLLSASIHVLVLRRTHLADLIISLAEECVPFAQDCLCAVIEIAPVGNTVLGFET
jgi:hypothetical protein